jgi:uncharacterized membrane protein
MSNKMNKHLRVAVIVSCSLFALMIVSIVLHNVLSVPGKEEAVFFSVALIDAFVFPASVLYVIILLITALVSKKP